MKAYRMLLLASGIVAKMYPHPGLGISNRWTGVWNGMVEWKMKWNGECTQL